MFTISKIKWFVSLILAGILLVLALIGGKWGTNYSASANVNATPVIDYIQPSAVPAGSPETIMIIAGSNFGTLQDTTVRLVGGGVDQTINPFVVTPNGISVAIPADLLVVPADYLVTVIWSDYGTIPTIPTIPPHDYESNQVPFTVFLAQLEYLPIVTKN